MIILRKQREFSIKSKAAMGGLKVMDKLAQKGPKPVSTSMGGIVTPLG